MAPPTPSSSPARTDAAAQLAQALHEAVAASDLSYADVARRLNVEARTLRRYRRGTRCPSRETVVQLEQMLGIADGHLRRLRDAVDTAGTRHGDDDPAPDEPTPSAPRRRPAARRLLAGLGAAAALVGTLLVVVSAGGGRGTAHGDADRDRFPRSYTGPVWTRLIAGSYGADGQTHAITLKWGPVTCKTRVRVGDRPTYLVTRKSKRDSIPLRVGSVPASTIAFGHGAQPPVGGIVVPIDNCWRKG